MTKLGAQIAAQDQHALVVGAATEGRFPFDVNNPIPSSEGLSGDTRRTAETEVAQVVNRQPIHLTHHGAGEIQQQRPILHHLLNPFLHLIQPVDLLCQRLLHVFTQHRGTRILTGPVIRFDQQVFDLAKTGRELFLVGHHSGRLFDHPGRAIGVEGAKPLVFASPADEGTICIDVFRRDVDFVVELGLYFEQIPKVFIVHRCKEAVGRLITGDYHLYVQRDRLRAQPLGHEKPALLSRVFQTDLPVANDPFQTLPYRGRTQHVSSV